MFNRSAIATMTKSTKSILLSEYFSIMSAALKKSSLVGYTKRGFPAAAKRRNDRNSSYPKSRIAMYASSGKTGVGNSGLDSLAIIGRQRSCAPSLGANSASTNPVSSNALMYLLRLTGALESIQNGDQSLPLKFLQLVPRQSDPLFHQCQSRENVYAHPAAVQIFSAEPKHPHSAPQPQTHPQAANIPVESEHLRQSL